MFIEYSGTNAESVSPHPDPLTKHNIYTCEQEYGLGMIYMQVLNGDKTYKVEGLEDNNWVTRSRTKQRLIMTK